MIARLESGCPRRPNTPKPAIQNAAVLFKSADWLVGMYWIAHRFRPLLATTISTPSTRPCVHSTRPRGQIAPPR